MRIKDRVDPREQSSIIYRAQHKDSSSNNTVIIPKVVYTIVRRKCEMCHFLNSYPKRAFANPIIHFAEDVDQKQSYIYCF